MDTLTKHRRVAIGAVHVLQIVSIFAFGIPSFVAVNLSMTSDVWWVNLLAGLQFAFATAGVTILCGRAVSYLRHLDD